MSAEELRAQINQATGLPLMPGAESTSARLARVEAELGRARDRVAQLERLAATALAQNLKNVMAERDRLLEVVATQYGRIQRLQAELHDAQQALTDAVADREQLLNTLGETADRVMADGWERVADQMATEAHSVVQAVVQAAQTDTETETP